MASDTEQARVNIHCTRIKYQVLFSCCGSRLLAVCCRRGFVRAAYRAGCFVVFVRMHRRYVVPVLQYVQRSNNDGVGEVSPPSYDRSAGRGEGGTMGEKRPCLRSRLANPPYAGTYQTFYVRMYAVSLYRFIAQVKAPMVLNIYQVRSTSKY